MATRKIKRPKAAKRASAGTGQAASPKRTGKRQAPRKTAPNAKVKRVKAGAQRRPRFKNASGAGIVALDARRDIGSGDVIGGALRRKFTGAGDSTNSVIDNGGGPVLTDVPLRLVFWGREWGQTTPPVPSANIVSDVETILAGPYLDATRQYGITNAYVDRVLTHATDDPPNPFQNQDAGNFIAGLIENGTFPEPDDDYRAALYVVFLPQQVGPPGMQQTLRLPPNLGGLHSFSTYSDTDLLDFDNDRFYWAWVFNNGVRANISSLFSHELVEALTDPSGDAIQIKPRSDTNWNEIGDVCSSTWVLNGVTVQSYWSKIDNACVVPDHIGNDYEVKWIYRPNRIEWLGGTMGDGTQWQLPRQQVMNRLRAGDQYFVQGPQSGSKALVGIYYLDATHPYLATAPDGTADDNLLSLPQHPPS